MWYRKLLENIAKSNDYKGLTNDMKHGVIKSIRDDINASKSDIDKYLDELKKSSDVPDEFLGNAIRRCRTAINGDEDETDPRDW